MVASFDFFKPAIVVACLISLAGCAAMNPLPASVS